MAKSRKGKVGRWDNSFEYKGKIPKLDNVGQIKPSKQWSPQYPDPSFGDVANEACTETNDINLDTNLFGGPGRTQGEVVLYEASQTENYKIIMDRYSRSINLVPSYVKNPSKNNYVLGFCTKNNSNGFWEVKVSFGNGTYVRFLNPNLIIPCPSPFPANDLAGIETDATELLWEQIQGRVTIISPPSGEGSINPVISIIGNRTSLDPPILIKVSLVDDPNTFDLLAIDTTITERVKSISSYSRLRYDPQYMITFSLFFPVRSNPTGVQDDYIVSLENSSWSVPNTSYKNDYLGLTLEQNKTGVWEEVETVLKDEQQELTLELFVHYRFVTLYGKHGTTDWFVVSQAIYLLNYEPRGVVIDEAPIENISCQNNLKSTFAFTSFSAIVKQENEVLGNISCLNSVKASFTYSPFTVIIREGTELTDQAKGISCQNKLKSTFKTDPLGGIIIG
jgi:hypothetical protein